jgi:putative heme-binding domain-containing protein
MRFVLVWIVCAAGGLFAAQTNVQMLVPGFTAQELPVHLANINNLRFAPDGRLFALGYNGKVYLLRDSDGDGLEDRAEVFWDQPTLNVPVGMVLAPEGIYIASHGKVSLLIDTNRDGRADIEKVLASGWPATDAKSGGVDAAGLAKDYEGNVYFGLITADYSNPYRVKDGVARYDLNGPRGTIQKLTPDGKLHTVATGIRVPYTLAFNKAGDLLMTDQEGETWCPNGNPLDELNHIVPGRNYGFPPRHPEYLPKLVSERPVVGFGPQHQSTCGLVFNEPTREQGRFGPGWWEGDAFVAGQSRGKVWRVRLVKTRHGYIGREYLIASLNMLTLDLAISRAGALYVSCHSGPPDWGTGPNGEGRVFKITYTDPRAPQPVLAASFESRGAIVYYDRPLDDSATNAWIGMTIEHGDYVRAGDQFESIRPGYKVVKEQQEAARAKIRALGSLLSPDNRAIHLLTEEHPEDATYAFTARGISANDSAPTSADLAFDHAGVKASWRAPTDDSNREEVWLPHLDLRAALEWMRGTSVPGSVQRWAAAARRASDTSRQLNLDTHLSFPPGDYTLHFESEVKFTGALDAASAGTNVRRASQPAADGKQTLELKWTASTNQPRALQLTFASWPVSGAPSLDVFYTSADDAMPRQVPPKWLVNPPAARPKSPSLAANRSALEISGGDLVRGKALFFGEQLKCSTCHRVRGEGGDIGPDLSNLTHRDAASVLRDIREPSATIHPDFVAYNVVPKNGEALHGFIRAHGDDAVRVVAADGKETPVRRADIGAIKAGAVSLMPEGLLAASSEQDVRDLLSFLLTSPPAEKAKARK